MARIIAKFGGTSVADVSRIKMAAEKIAQEHAQGHEVVVVVSAMAGTTNQLIDYCREVCPIFDAQEYDAVVASGEQITAGLLALALQRHGIEARSWLGWQISIHCDDTHGKARILNIDRDKVIPSLEKRQIAVIAGFQGVTEQDRIVTLGRGGSDTSAVALAAALEADRCDIYTDVEGIYTTDPRIVPEACKMKHISYEEMLELASLGAKVLQTRSVEMAMKHGVALQVLSSFKEHIGSYHPGTLVMREEQIMEQPVVRGVTYSRDEAKITILGLSDIPGVAAKVFAPLSAANINVDMIVQNVSVDGQHTDMTFTVPQQDASRAVKELQQKTALAEADIRLDSSISKISVVGIAMKSHAGVAQTMFQTLAAKGINIQVISTSEIKISILIESDYTELAVRTLHTAYGLDESF